MKLDADTRVALLDHARRALEAAGGGGPAPPTPPLLHRDDLAEHGGVFVTLKRSGALRGCIGCFGGRVPLPEAVARMARQSAVEDPRFPAVTEAEVPGLRISLSILSTRRPCADPMDIEVGRHGVEIERGDRRGVFLPQVAPEQGWDRAALLRHLCTKAGLPTDAWRAPDALLWTFEATVFGE